MTIQEYRDLLNRHARDIENLARTKMPVIIGQMAVSHFKNNFRQSGFVNNGLQAWTPAKRIGKNNYAGNNYGTLLSGRNHLMNSIRYIPGDAKVTVGNSVEYATIHNEGGTFYSHPAVTRKMRKFAWAKFYEIMGGRPAAGTPIPVDAQKWRNLALTKKNKLNIKVVMPKRQFIGDSKELNDKIANKFETEIAKILGL
jgi:phage gpG-like protein